MPFSLQPATLGSASFDALAAAVREAQAHDRLSNVTVVVPTNTAGVIARRVLAKTGGLAAVQFLTIYRLAELLAGHHLAAQGRRPLTTPVLNASLRAALRAEPGIFAPVNEHEATVEGLRTSYRELRELPPRFVDVLGAQGSTMTTEVVRLHSAVQGRLWRNWHDETDLMLEAAKVIEPHDAERFGDVVVYLPERLSPASIDLIVGLSGSTNVRAILGTTGDERADRNVQRLAASIADRCELDLGAVVWPAPPSIDAHVDVVSASDADDEVRAAVRRIVRAAHEGVAFERIAVLWTAADPYARAVTSALDNADIPWNGPSPSRLAERLGGRALLGLLSIDRFGFRRRDLFAWLATTPVRDEQRRFVPTATWERLSRDAGVGGRGDWQPRLQRWADELHQRAAGALAAGDDHRSTRYARDAEQCLALARFVAWLRDELREPTTTRRWEAWGEWSHIMLRRLLGAERARADLPLDEQEAVELVEAAVDRLAGLDDVAERVNRVGFSSALEAELDAALGRVGRIGDGVLLGPLSTAIGLDADVTIVLGAVDGRLPTAPVSDPLIGDRDRRLVPLLRSGADGVALQRRHLIAALRSAPEIMVGVARGDLRRSAVHSASRWISELVPPDARHEHHLRSFTHGLGVLEFPATAAEHRIRSLLAHVRSGAPIETHRLARTDRAFAQNLALVRAREAPIFSEFDGNLAGVDLPPTFTADRVFSPTQLEKWAACPLRYFVEHILGVTSVDDRDDDLRINALDRGSLLHDVFDRFLQLVLTGELMCPEPDQPWSEAHRAAAFEVLDATALTFEEAGKTGRPLLWQFDRNHLRTELRTWLNRDDSERAVFGTKPIGSEQRFGFPDSWPAATVALPNGQILRFRGSIDRLDQRADGRIFVTDHKTGSGSKYRTIKASNPVDGGRCLQLGVYAAAVATHLGLSQIGITSEYSFTGRSTGPKRNGYEITAEVWDIFVRTLETIVDGMSQGVFPARPKEPAYFQAWVDCPICDPDGLGTHEMYRSWLRMIDDPALAPVVSLDEIAPR